jgi:hypothetical protein
MAAAVLLAARARVVMMHGAIRTHVVHRHVTLGRARHACRRRHAASNACQSRLRREHCDQRNSDELEELLHPLRKTIHPNALISECGTEIRRRAESVKRRSRRICSWRKVSASSPNTLPRLERIADVCNQSNSARARGGVILRVQLRKERIDA